MTLSSPQTMRPLLKKHVKALGQNLWQSSCALYKNTIYRRILWGVTALLLAVEHTCFRVNVTESLPQTFWWGVRGVLPQKGDFVMIQKTTWGSSMLKQVTGVEGDRVQRKGSTICINDQHFCDLQSSAPSGLDLKPLADLVIPRGYVFVSTSSPKGFDSRYKKFGLVSVLDCHAIMKPLSFVRGGQ